MNFELREIKMQDESFGKVLLFPLIQLSKSFNFHSVSHKNQTNNHNYLFNITFQNLEFWDVTVVEPKGPHVDIVVHEPPPPDHDWNGQTEVEVADLADKPTRSIHNDDGPPSPAKATNIPTTPTQTTGNKADDVVITGVSYTSRGNPVVLAKHSAKEERAAMEKGKWSTDLSSYAHLSA